MQLFYNPQINEGTEVCTFSKEESKHIAKVLRKSNGDLLHLTNGKGWLFEAKIIDTNLKQCSAKIISKQLQATRSYSLNLAVAPTKMNDRFEWFLEKATEFGINSITPILCDHSERKVIKYERFEKIIQTAMKQSLQCYLPTLNPLTSFSEFVANDTSTQRFIAHCQQGDKQEFFEVLRPGDSVTVLIGPEGDFSRREIEMVKQMNYQPVSLGTNRLRTETAAIAVTHIASLVNLNKG